MGEANRWKPFRKSKRLTADIGTCDGDVRSAAEELRGHILDAVAHRGDRITDHGCQPCPASENPFIVGISLRVHIVEARLRRVEAYCRTASWTRVEFASRRPRCGWLVGRTCARLVVCRRREYHRVAAGGECVEESSDVDFGPAIVVRKDDVNALAEG